MTFADCSNIKVILLFWSVLFSVVLYCSTLQEMISLICYVQNYLCPHNLQRKQSMSIKEKVIFHELLTKVFTPLFKSLESNSKQELHLESDSYLRVLSSRFIVHYSHIKKTKDTNFQQCIVSLINCTGICKIYHSGCLKLVSDQKSLQVVTLKR